MNIHPAIEPMFQDSRLILSAGTIVKATFTERVKAAQQAGFDAISLFPQQYLAARRKERLSIENMQEILAEHKVSLDEVDPLLDWFGPQASSSEILMMEMAEGLGARSVNVAAAFVSDRPFEEIVESFARVCERVAKYGLRADLEFLPWTQVNNLTTALKLLDEAGQSNSGVMFDFWHFFNGDESMDVLHNLTPEHAAGISSLQLNNVPSSISDLSRGQNWIYTKDMFQNVVDSIRVLGLDSFLKVAAKAKYPHRSAQKMMKDALCSRLFPAQGSMPVVEVLSILSDKGVQPAIGIEVFNVDNYSRSAEELAQMAMRSYQYVVKHN
ncbi:MAG: TIM barrel protein [Pseudomonadales bacterium]